MPELPEVETIARDMRPHLQGAVIEAAKIFKPDILRNSKRPAFERALKGRLITRVWRRAKHLVLDLDDGNRVVIRPGMTGAMYAASRQPSAVKHDVLHLDLSNGRHVRYHDVRRLGGIFLLTPKQWGKYDAALGYEPLEAAFTGEALARVLSGSRAAVKKVIMDQKKVVGVGNIYASEALWMSRIDPSREARKITPAQAAELRDAIVDILERSIRGRGTTVRDYRTGTGEPGNFAGRLAVYERAGEPCLRCGTRIAMTHAIDARSSYFCPSCQRSRSTTPSRGRRRSRS